MRRDDWTDPGVLLSIAVLLLATVSFVSVIYALIFMPERICRDRAGMMGFPYAYSFTTGCMIEIAPRRWVHVDQYRASN